MSLTSEQERPGLRRCLGPLAVTAQAVGTVGLTLTAVINIPQVAAGAGLGTWTLLLGYGATLVACLAFLGFYLHHLLLHLGLVLARALCVLLGGLLCLELARRDVRLSTRTMLVTESISVVIVLGLCLQVLHHGGVRADLAALNPAGDSLDQLRSGLMAAVLSFIGFESAATLGAESVRPQRAVPQALR